MKTPDLSLVIPLFNEKDNLRELAAEIRASLADHRWSYEVLFVDDGSSDGSSETLTELSREDDRVRPLSLTKNSGQSAALLAGFRAALGQIIVTLDADLQNDPADIPALVEAIRRCDVVSGIRQERQDSWLRRVSSRLANAARRWFLGDTITDTGCALKAFRAPWLREIPSFQGLHRFLPGLLQAQGAVVEEIIVHHRPRIHGTSKYGVHNRLWRGLYDLIGVRWLMRRWISPRSVEEATTWIPRTSGSSSDSPARPFSSPAFSFSGSLPSGAERVSSLEPSGS